jgi:hypothetical protein
MLIDAGKKQPNRVTRAMGYKRVGGLVFWRVGRLGGSFYWSSCSPTADEKLAQRIKRARVRKAASAWHRYNHLIGA